jgi:hypothetical protein
MERLMIGKLATSFKIPNAEEQEEEEAEEDQE